MSDDKKNEYENELEAGNLLDKIQRGLRKSELEAVEASVKEKLKLRKQAERTIAQINLEIKKIIDDFNAGI